IGHAGIAAGEHSGRQVRKSLRVLARQIGVAIELGDLVSGNVCKFQEWIPAQTEVEGHTSADLEIVLEEGAVEIADQVVVQWRDLRECAALAVQEVSEIITR